MCVFRVPPRQTLNQRVAVVVPGRLKLQNVRTSAAERHDAKNNLRLTAVTTSCWPVEPRRRVACQNGPVLLAQRRNT